MVLGKQVEWAIHCCSILSGLPPDQYVSTRDLAEFHGVPKEYLSKALQGLAQAGLVLTALGPAGGYRLGRPPKDISFLDIIEAVEGLQPTFVCTEIRMNNPCLKKTAKESGRCAVAKAMHRADQAWRRELAAIDLEELGKQVAEAVPAEQRRKNREWFSRPGGEG